MSNRYFLALCVVTLLGAETWAAEHPKFVSQPVSGAIVIDGRHDDWSGAVEPFGTEPVSIQVANDGTFLYLRMVTSDPSARNQITRHGFIVWFDEDGKTKKRFGLKYPVVESSGEPQEGGHYAGHHGSGGTGADRERPSEESYEPADRIDILGSNKDDERSLTLDHAAGIEAAARMDQGTLRYELKVPLAKTTDHPYAIGTAPGKTIGIGLETPKPERSSSGGGGRGNGGGGYGGGGYGGHGGGVGGHGGMHGGGGHGEGEYQTPKPLNAWGTVALSVPPGR
jgi:hypothetical protein